MCIYTTYPDHDLPSNDKALLGNSQLKYFIFEPGIYTLAIVTSSYTASLDIYNNNYTHDNLYISANN